MGLREDPGPPSGRSTVDGQSVLAWLGLRYAVADERFAAARPATGRLSVSQLQEVPVFPQLTSRLAAAMGQGLANPQAEDAFFVNAWAPADAQGLPVVLFLHGGAWMTGGGAMPWYDGARLASRGLVVANANYRIGPLGHLGRPDAHSLPIPAADLLLALDWTRENVAALGGNPDRITVLGQSAGGWYAHLLSVLPETRGKIHRVALISMGTRPPWPGQLQIDVTERTRLGVGGDLLQAPVGQLLEAGMAALVREPARLGHAPSAFLPVASAGLPTDLLDPAGAARACHAAAVYLRFNADESAAFFFNDPIHRTASQDQVDDALSRWSPMDLPAELLDAGRFAGRASGLTPYRQLVAASSWRQFQRFPTAYAASLGQAGIPVDLVRFGMASRLDGLHSGHCFDLPFQFGNRAAWQDAPMLAGFDAEAFDAVSRPLISDIVAFACGRPDPTRPDPTRPDLT